MSRALSLARAIGSDGVLNVGDVAGLAAVASSGSASDLGTGTLPNARLASGAAVANLGYTPVNKAGDAITGPLSISGAHSASSPLLDLVASSGGAGAGTYLRGSRLLDPTMVAGQRVMYGMGRADTAKNMGQVYFGYAGSGSDANFIALGLHSVDEALVVYGNGAVTKPYQPLFSASDTRSLVFSSITQLDSSNCFNSIDYNIGGNFNASTGRFTAPVSGYYDVTFHCADGSATGRETNLRIKKNNVSNTGPLTEGYNQAGIGASNVFVRCVVQLSVGDYISFEAAALNTVAGIQHKRFIIHLIG